MRVVMENEKYFEELPDKCPNCRAKDVYPIEYWPLYPLPWEIKNKKIIIGICFPPENPKWGCINCKANIQFLKDFSTKHNTRMDSERENGEG